MRFCVACGDRFEDAVLFCPNDGIETRPLAEEAQGDPLIGVVLDGRYKVEAQIGEGGMGIVYRASHAVLKKPLAVKVLRPDMAKDKDVVERFIQEAQSASSIGHPNIVGVSDFGQLPSGAVYFVMEYLEGEPLTTTIARGGSIPVRDAVRIIEQIAAALGAAHARGIVHRDLKPDNIFLLRRGDSYVVKVLDFGIAKVGGAASRLTRTGQVFGTPHYMSPEQASGQRVDARTDIYSLGVIMYEMFCGVVPFEGDTFMGILTKHMFEPPIPPSKRGSAQLGALEDVVMRALEKKPEARYQSMDDLLHDVTTVVSGGSIPKHISNRPAALADALEPPSRTEMRLSAPSEPPRVKTSKAPLIFLAAAALALLGLAGGAVALVALGGSDDEEVAVVASPEPPPAAGEARPVVPPAPLPPTPSPPSPSEALDAIEIASTPPGAEVLVEGAIVGNTPFRLPRPPADAPREVEVRAPGYETARIRAEHGSPDRLAVTLTSARTARVVRRTNGSASRTNATAGTSGHGTQSTGEAQALKRRSTYSEVVDPWAQ